MQVVERSSEVDVTAMKAARKLKEESDGKSDAPETVATPEPAAPVPAAE